MAHSCGLALARRAPQSTEDVDAAYRQILERPSNGEGGNWVTQLNGGQLTVRELVRSIAKSPEHIRRFMAGGVTTDVTFAYKHLLGRAPDPAGLKAHEQVRTRENSAAVVDSLIDSTNTSVVQRRHRAGSRLRFAAPVAARQAGYGSRDGHNKQRHHRTQ